MDLVKYLIVGGGCLLVGIVISIISRNILAGLGFAVLGSLAYILWNFFNSAKKEEPPKDN